MHLNSSSEYFFFPHDAEALKNSMIFLMFCEHYLLSLCSAKALMGVSSDANSPGAPLTYFNDRGWGPTEVHILYPKKSLSVFASANFIIYLLES